jgi:hypothetical protein
MSWTICIVFSISPVLTQVTPGGVSELRVEKTGFALGEDIEFEIELTGLTDKQINALFDSGAVGHLEITTPDGKMKTWPVNLCYGHTGMGRPFVLGANEIPKEHVVPGRYTLAFLYAGERSKTVTVTVADLPALKQVQASLHLKGAPGFPQSLATTPATLIVQNNSTQTVRFARLSEMEGMTFSVHVNTGNWAGSDIAASFGEPFGAVGFSWDTIMDPSVVVIKPRAKFQQQISLKPALEDSLDYFTDGLPVPAGQYEVNLGQNLYVFIGDRQDAQAGFFPVHLLITASAEFTAERHGQN